MARRCFTILRGCTVGQEVLYNTLGLYREPGSVIPYCEVVQLARRYFTMLGVVQWARRCCTVAREFCNILWGLYSGLVGVAPDSGVVHWVENHLPAIMVPSLVPPHLTVTHKWVVWGDRPLKKKRKITLALGLVNY